MFIWLLALLFLGIFGAIGFRSGAVRMAVALVGTAIALAAAAPLGGLIAPLVAKLTKTNLAVQYFMPALVAFLILWIVCYAIGFAAHRPVELHFKYREDDATRAGFERVNQAGGLFFGILIAFILFFQAGRHVYAGGYLSSQVMSEERDPGWVKFGTTLRREMESTGWDKSFAPLDRTPDRFYEVSDMLGLLHENPPAHDRFRDYPEFIDLADRQEFRELGADKDFQELVRGRSGLLANYNDSRIQSLASNSELTDRLLAVDFQDFETFLAKAESPKYADEKIIGRWRVDVNAVLLQQRRTRDSITPTQFAMMRVLFGMFLSPIRVHVYSDGSLVILNEELPAPTPEPDPNDPNFGAPPADPSNPYAADPGLAARYGIGGRVPGAAPAAAAGPQSDFERQFAQAVVRSLGAALSSRYGDALSRQLGEMFGGRLSIGGENITIPFSGNNMVNLPKDGSWTRVGARYRITAGEGDSGLKFEGAIDENGRLVWNLKQFNAVLYFLPSAT